MKKKVLVGLLLAIFLAGVVARPSLATSVVDDYVIVSGVSYSPGDEILEKRTENSKTTYVGNGRYSLRIFMGAIHYKNNYSSPSELWKDIDTTIVNGVVTKAPFILTVDTAQKSVYILNRKDLSECTLQLTGLLFGQSHTPMGVSTPVIEGNTVTWRDVATDTDLVLIVENNQVRFQRVLKSDKAPNTSIFSVVETGKSYLIYRAYNAQGLPIEFVANREGSVLTEKVNLSKIEPVEYPIRIDPTWQVGTSTDDAFRRLTSSYFSLTINSNRAGAFQTDFYQEGSGMRFTAIAIPNAAIIDNAYLLFRCVEGDANTVVRSRISAENVDDAPTFADSASAFDSRWANRTAARVDWDNIPPWSADEEGPDTTSPEIKTVIQEIVDRGGWVSG